MRHARTGAGYKTVAPRTGLVAVTGVPLMARKLLILLALAAPLVACGNPHKAEYDAAIQGCKTTYPAKAGTMVTRMSCLHQQRDRYGVLGPNEALARAIAISYATKVDNKQMSVVDADVAVQREFFDINQQSARTGAAVAAGNGMAMQGSAAMRQSLTPPSPVVTNCSRFGNMVNCTSN
jgi:hypothetical protein